MAERVFTPPELGEGLEDVEIIEWKGWRRVTGSS
jgi:hypothetical protein